MLIEVVFTTELCSAVSAAERFPVGVRHDVPRQRRPRQELDLAQVALVLAADRVSASVLALLLF